MTLREDQGTEAKPRIPADPDPNCTRCRGTGEEPNAQFRCPCRWRFSGIDPAVSAVYDAVDANLTINTNLEATLAEAREEIARLNRIIEITNHHVERLLPCPDCRDKVERGKCERCARQRAEERVERAEAALQQSEERVRTLRERLTYIEYLAAHPIQQIGRVQIYGAADAVRDSARKLGLMLDTPSPAEEPRR